MEITLLLYPLFFFIIGLFFGSFLNVVADRLVRGESFLWSRSQCEDCHHTLSFFDLIPVVSFLLLKGKCKYCRKKLSWYYPFSELVTGVLFALTYALFAPVSVIVFVYTIIIICGLFIIFTADIKYGIIPDKVIYPLFVFVFIYQLMFQASIISFLLSSLGAGLFFLLLFFITKGKGMGFGDVKFAFLMGLVLGFPDIIYALYMAFLTGAAVSLILILWKKKQIKSTIPFGPFLTIATVLGILFPQGMHAIANMILP